MKSLQIDKNISKYILFNKFKIYLKIKQGLINK